MAHAGFRDRVELDAGCAVEVITMVLTWVWGLRVREKGQGSSLQSYSAMFGFRKKREHVAGLGGILKIQPVAGEMEDGPSRFFCSRRNQEGIESAVTEHCGFKTKNAGEPAWWGLGELPGAILSRR